jgi:Ca2+-binding RTX toxin-like protein
VPTSLNTGLGDDVVHVMLHEGSDGFFVLNTQGQYFGYLPLVLSSGDSWTPADTVAVRYTVDGVTRTLTQAEYLVDHARGVVGLLVSPPEGASVSVHVTRYSSTFDVTTGDRSVLTSDLTAQEFAAPYSLLRDRDKVYAQSSTLPLVIFGGQDADEIHGGLGGDVIFGDRGLVLYFDQTLPVPEVCGSAANVTCELDAAAIQTLRAFAAQVYGLGGYGDRTDGALRALSLAISLDPTVGGDDVISTGTSAARDLVVGGAGADRITTNREENGGTDGYAVVLGDNGMIDFALVDGLPGNLDRVWTIRPEVGGADTIDTGRGGSIVIGGAGGDIVRAVGGRNVVLGDSGRVTAAGVDSSRFGSLPITLGLVTSIATGIGGADDITTGSGDDIVIGGALGDTIRAGGGNNIVLGDSGLIDWTAYERGFRLVGDDVDPSDIDRISSLTPHIGGRDIITTGSGTDIVLGGFGDDDIIAGDGQNLVLGDSGEIYAGSRVDSRFGALPITLGVVASTGPEHGGNDVIITGSGKDIVLGGVGHDTITVGSGDDIVLGDNGRIEFTDIRSAAATAPELRIHRIATTDHYLGGRDVVWGGAGDDLIIGGSDNDALGGDDGSDLIFGDQVELVRRLVLTNPRFRALTGTIIYSRADLDPTVTSDPTGGPNDSGTALVDGTWRDYRDTDGSAPDWAYYEITNLFHSDAIAAAPVSAGGVPAYGDDYITGGAGDDTIFGQLGNDTILGDGRLDDPVAGAWRSPSADDPLGPLTVRPAVERFTDGDDYIEGGGGNDVIFGGLGQDDIIGGSSSLFTLTQAHQRPDGHDYIFGGTGGADIERNAFSSGIPEAERHSRDADTIVGDNGDIYRIVGRNGADGWTGGSTPLYVSFAYDNYGGRKIVVRAVTLLDYSPGGPDYHGFTPTAANPCGQDRGGHDEIHGGSGDDTVYGGCGNDRLFGDADDDDLIGGWGHDWISGGTGTDGLLGDDGRIFTSRNGTAEPLYGIAATTQQYISTPGKVQQATINPTDMLTKSVDLTPFNVAPRVGNQAPNPHYVALYADDVLYGGLGDDFLHGGAGNDAMSGAEAPLEGYSANLVNGLLTQIIRTDWTRPYNPGDLLRYGDGTRGSEFALYDEYNPLGRISINGKPFFLDFNSTEGPFAPNSTKRTDGNDVLFGDLGHDWLVGGTGRDTLYGGFGNDLLDADDDHSTNGGLNNQPDTDTSYEDLAFGGAGVDILIGNTGGDRLIDWAGEFNSYIVPFAPFGLGTVSRQLSPGLREFLYALSKSQGADATRGGDPTRNGEPDGELGLVTQADPWWQEQTGAPVDPQAGNVPGGARDVLRSADFSTGSTEDFAPDSGIWTATGGVLSVEATGLGGDAVAVYNVQEYLPTYYEVFALVRTAKPTAGWNANAYVIFDYYSPTDFRFAGINVSTNKFEMGQRTASGWQVLAQDNVQVKPDTYYAMLVAVNGTHVTVSVDGVNYFSWTFPPRLIDGVQVGLNHGFIGVGSQNARGIFDSVSVRVLPVQITVDQTETFADGRGRYDDTDWTASGGRLTSPTSTDANPVFLDGITSLSTTAVLELTAVLRVTGQGGLVFDYNGPQDYKFVYLDVVGQRVLIGYRMGNAIHNALASIPIAVPADRDSALQVTIKGVSVAVHVNGSLVRTHSFNAAVGDGRFGLLTISGTTSFDIVRFRGDDPKLSGLGAVDPGLPSVGLTGAIVTEGDSGTRQALLTITLSEPSTTTVTVGWMTADGTALAGEDYVAATGVVTFAPGETTKTIAVTVIGDTVVEPDETFRVLLRSVVGATLGDEHADVLIRNDDAAPALPVVIITATTPTAVEGGAAGVITVARTGSTSATLQVTLTWSGSAEFPADYTVSVTGGSLNADRSVLTIAAGVATATLTVTPVVDTTTESSEMVVVALGASSVYTGSGTATVTIEDAPAPSLPTVSIDATAPNASEAGPTAGTVTVSRSGSTAAALQVLLIWNGTATLTDDYTITVLGGTLSADRSTLTISAGWASAVITIVPVTDTNTEGSETVVVAVLASPHYTGTGTATVTITDAHPTLPTVTISATAPSAAEVGPVAGVITVSRTGSTAATLQVGLVWSGAAGFPADYDLSVTGGTLSADRALLTIAVGSTEAALTITPKADDLVEGSESVVVSLGSSTAYTGSGTATVTIADAPPPVPTVTITASASDASEVGPTSGAVTVSRTGSTSTALQVALTWNGSAVFGDDYTVTVSGGSLSGDRLLLTIAAGSSSATLTITPKADTLVEGSETVVVALGAPSGWTGSGSATVTIADAPAPSLPVVSITATAPNASEVGPTAGTITVARTGGTTGALQVNLTWNGTATAGTDYTVTVSGGTLSGTLLTFSVGSASVVITITPVQDTNATEGTETVIVGLASGSGYTGTGTATVGIADALAATTPPIASIQSTSVLEGASKTTKTVRMKVVLSAAATTDVVVRLRITGGTATSGSDYRAWSPTERTVTILAGKLVAEFEIVVIGDNAREANETVVISIVGITGATGLNSTGTLTILDDDSKLTTIGEGPGADRLLQSDAERLLAVAVDIWRASGVPAARLAGVRVVVTDLAPGELGHAVGRTIYLDADAAGWGWHLDPMSAVPADRIDLLTVLLHELGHVLGLDHADTGLMSAVLVPGLRIHDVTGSAASGTSPATADAAVVGAGVAAKQVETGHVAATAAGGPMSSAASASDSAGARSGATLTSIGPSRDLLTAGGLAVLLVLALLAGARRREEQEQADITPSRC